MADSRNLMHSDSSLETERLSQEAQRWQNEQNELETPLKMAERAQKIAKAEEDKRWIDSGKSWESRQQEFDAKAQELISKMDDNQRKQLADKSNSYIAVDEMTKGKSEPEIQMMWPEIAQRMREGGVKNFPPVYSPEVMKQMQMKAKAAWRTAKVIADEQAATTEHERKKSLEEWKNSRNVENAATEHTYKKELEDIKGKWDVRKTQAAASADRQKVGGSLENAKRKIIAYQLDPDKEDVMKITEMELALLETEERGKFDQITQRNMANRMAELQIMALGKDTKPEQRAKYEAEADAIKRDLRGPNYEIIQQIRAAKKAKASGKPAPAATTTAPGTPSTTTPRSRDAILKEYGVGAKE